MPKKVMTTLHRIEYSELMIRTTNKLKYQMPLYAVTFVIPWSKLYMKLIRVALQQLR